MKNLILTIGLIATTSQLHAETLDNLAHRDKDAAIERVLPIFLGSIERSEHYKKTKENVSLNLSALQAAIIEGDASRIKQLALSYAEAYGELKKSEGYAKGLATAMVVSRIMRPIETTEEDSE
ncbi:hypothetical protein [Deefgea salmonis]|uniref:Uncharacterized protein n=1 Tax=Deefgea salmonis TaxID=2875502 RepID=A0ABS8BL53_9NEIS|nr:hypothetical protein [Deefgea salmonis]MCB5196448.1 hypothetical protein [Deefgea salmonis]